MKQLGKCTLENELESTVLYSYKRTIEIYASLGETPDMYSMQ